jgi:hypothetical protein
MHILHILSRFYPALVRRPREIPVCVMCDTEGDWCVAETSATHCCVLLHVGSVFSWIAEKEANKTAVRDAGQD